MGNQMFMYASAFSISKKLGRSLYIDDETAFLSKKNVSKFGLNSFNITSSIAPDELKFKNLSGYIKRKLLICFLRQSFLAIDKLLDWLSKSVKYFDHNSATGAMVAYKIIPNKDYTPSN